MAVGRRPTGESHAKLREESLADLATLDVSGVGAGSTERGRVMWARVRGESENALLALPLETYVLRPGYIQPRHVPRHVSSTDQLGRAMVALARRGAPERILTSRQFNALS